MDQKASGTEWSERPSTILDFFLCLFGKFRVPLDNIHVRNGKGGRERVSPIIGKNAAQIVERIRSTPSGEKVWQHIHQSADIHGYRAEYATDIYRAHARPIEEIPYDRVNKGTGRKFQSDVYTCRKDESGKKLDKKAMLICSKALGHNRIEVVANNYIRGL